MKYLKIIIRYFLLKFNLKIFRINPYSVFDFESFLYRHLAVYKTITFIQIGANDGILNDPIYNFNTRNKDLVSGYVLEPLPDIFEMLVENYKSCLNIKPINLAIHSHKDEMVMHRVKPEFSKKLHEFSQGIASFDENHWKKSKLLKDSKAIERVKVNCISFAKFIESNNINKLDLLLIDTEGYDYEILMSINFSIIKPKIIRFEHGFRNEVMSRDEFLEVCKLLNANGYQIITESYDATAYLLNPNDLVF
jgi:FkbM family methyltransferase